jgi:hypothetical protein
MDLVDQMMWEDLTDFLTLEEAGLEESGSHPDGDSGVCQYVEWFYDGEDSSYENN